VRVPELVFVQPDGSQQRVPAVAGRTVMEAARDHQVRGIRAECGGECSCSTCHCYVDDGWLSRLPPKADAEAGLLEFAWEPRPNSRLTCQLLMSDALDGLVLHVPEQQL
jgi:2Fe-2S ferredoxin